jgi:cell division protein FtsW (lipid II flippase)
MALQYLQKTNNFNHTFLWVRRCFFVLLGFVTIVISNELYPNLMVWISMVVCIVCLGILIYPVDDLAMDGAYVFTISDHYSRG